MARENGTILMASRDITATDGAAVNGSAVSLPRSPVNILGYFAATTTGSPTTYDVRAVIEGSFDGTTWFQLLRFADITNAAATARLARVNCVAAAAEAAVVSSALGSAAASATILDGPFPRLLRAATKLQTLTGGTSPHILPVVYLEFVDGG